MDFGAVDLEGLVGPENGVSSQVVSDHKATYSKSDSGSGLLKQGRSGFDEDNWRGSKVARTDDSENPKTMLNLQGLNTRLLRSNSLLAAADSGQHQNMLSFSSTRSDVPFLCKSVGLAERSSSSQQSPHFPYYHTTYPYTRNAGHGSGGLNVIGARGPFTPSQWIELEHQALIYKYIVANVPVPSNLLIALKKSINPYGLCGLSSGSYAPNSLGWGSFHLGFSGSTDPEPGRCRRTDGKKWRCSRDAVADQKYCERHINRGRHRSRKPVEGRTGQPVSGSTTTKMVSIASSTSATVMSSSGATKSLSMTHHQFEGLQPGAANPSADVLVKRMQDSEVLSVLSPTTNLKSKDSPFSLPKQHISIEESSHSEFGLVSSDSLLSPSQKNSYMNSRNYNSILDFSDHKSHDQHPPHHFIDDWPKDQSSRTTIAWPEELKSDWTQLSMSIPMSTSDFSSTSSSSPQDKISPSPIRLSCEFDPTQMCLAVNQNLSELTQKQTNWVPVSWEGSMGGPLGEVLNSTTSTMGASNNSSGLNLMTGVWNSSSQLGSSPTGVLQRTTFVSLSNSSSGSSPRANYYKKSNETGSLGDDMLGSTFASSFSIPSL